MLSFIQIKPQISEVLVVLFIQYMYMYNNSSIFMQESAES